jgi:hypothetical protein
MACVALDDLDQVRDEIVPFLEHDVDVRPGGTEHVPKADQPVEQEDAARERNRKYHCNQDFDHRFRPVAIYWEAPFPPLVSPGPGQSGELIIPAMQGKNMFRLPSFPSVSGDCRVTASVPSRK